MKKGYNPLLINAYDITIISKNDHSFFDIRINNNRFCTEWENGLKIHFPDLMIIWK